ncbi:NAD(P)/FAD-dependent oxidoreductase [Hathewaya histolytica]|uniref:Flavoprotein n=1 Tax=Hathewaya histolytica TaxID=1498 RepID=A0A4U9RWY0_HATHI|nr:NAD(P)/FAD-dependent oxidoreductase [Hathewaya histolytica]VTQ96378.1 flavoprotein [Hathewaya histolytica]
MIKDLIIIGGGASGLVASIIAKDFNSNITLLEGTDRIGRKILTTGNGRCNISNKYINIKRYHSDLDGFGEKVLNQFNNEDTINFFSSIGLPLRTLEGGKMYPLSLQSSAVLDILKLAIEEREINLQLNSKVKNIELKKDIFYIYTEKDILKSKKVLLCTGGKSYVGTGSDGSGYTLAKNLGHSIINTIPSIVQIKLNHDKLKAISGVKFEGSAEILVEGKSIKKEYGEILFTDYGISGPPILQLSRIASSKSESNNMNLTIDMFPQMSKEHLRNFLENHFGAFGYRSIYNCFIGIINKKLIPIFLKESGVTDIHKEAYHLTWDEKENLLNNLKNWTFEVSGTNTFREAQVTAGGINTKEVDEETLESKIIPGLYFAGEILDIDGDCGGFNLQWAWSSGVVSSRSALSKQV